MPEVRIVVMEPRMVSESDMRSAQTVHCAHALVKVHATCHVPLVVHPILIAQLDVLGYRALGKVGQAPGAESRWESRLPKMLQVNSSSSGLGGVQRMRPAGLHSSWHMARVQVARRTSRASTADRLWPVEPYGSWFGGAEGRFRRLPLARRTPSAHPIAKRWRTATNSLANILNTQTFSRRDRPASSELRCSRRAGRKPTGHACRIAYDCST